MSAPWVSNALDVLGIGSKYDALATDTTIRMEQKIAEGIVHSGSIS